jgi:DNA-binding MarR family transcriptional regulator
MSRKITEKQREVLAYIMEYLVENDPFSPSQAEIAEHFDCSRQTAQKHVQALIEKGYLKRHSKLKHRNIMIVQRDMGDL